VAKLCLGLATSHLAHIVNARHLGDPKQVATFDAGYQRLAEALADAEPDVSLIISADHVNKFFIDNMPAFCIGTFDEFSACRIVTCRAISRLRAIWWSAASTRGSTGR
jgi:hypothetical protein